MRDYETNIFFEILIHFLSFSKKNFDFARIVIIE